MIQHFFQNIEGWFNFIAIYHHAVQIADDGDHFVEVGAWKGKSTAFLATEIVNSGKKIKFDVIDTWLGSDVHQEDPSVKEGTLYKEFINNMKPVEGYYTPIQNTSVEAAKLYEDESLDMVLIDANHAYNEVKEDILAWLPKVKPGGILAGDDYHHTWPGVIRAVGECLPVEDVQVIDGCTWAWQKPYKEEVDTGTK